MDQIEARPLRARRHISLAPVFSAYFSNELSVYLTRGSRLSMFRAVENGVARPQEDAHVLFAVCRLTLPMECPPLTPKQSLHA
jgi:hypothetical protein